MSNNRVRLDRHVHHHKNGAADILVQSLPQPSLRPTTAPLSSSQPLSPSTEAVRASPFPSLAVAAVVVRRPSPQSHFEARRPSSSAQLAAPPRCSQRSKYLNLKLTTQSICLDQEGSIFYATVGERKVVAGKLELNYECSLIHWSLEDFESNMQSCRWFF
ncbi:hypothetical protein PIB30_050531 [Stylosanthes scabra]|uniref:Uncharacterized protein n=1 Tax=Stylosanthes scabra TaxID=79078 RepID=A0ABU6VFP7_9FABA|nr:hypothetical protein [Stylosanthes scabra]